jgi:hypothetical protein
MPWIAENLWLIRALPLSAAVRSKGAERRQKVAHGVSRGLKVKTQQAP